MLVQFKYYNPGFNIAFNSWREVYLATDCPVLLKPEIHRGSLVYRMPGNGRRISYKKLKQGMLKQNIELQFELLPKPPKISWL